MPTVAFIPDIGREGFVRYGGDLAFWADLEFQGGREALILRIVWRASNNEWNHLPVWMPRFEQAEFFVDVVALGRSGRADDD